MTSPADLDVLRQIGRAAMVSQQPAAIVQDSTDWLAARKLRSTFAAAAWLAGASHKQIGDVLGIRPQTVHRLVAALIPSALRREISAGRNIGKELILYERVRMMKDLFDKQGSGNLAQAARLLAGISKDVAE